MPTHDASDDPHAADRSFPSPPPPQLLCDPLSQATVFLAPQRGLRPIELGDAGSSPDARQPMGCPFCRGHETLAPPSVLALPSEGVWQARVVPNRYPIVAERLGVAVQSAPEELAARAANRPAVGMHEVLIESPEHHTRVEAIPAATWGTAWCASRQRLEAFAACPQLRWGMVFKNAGPRAGASLAHAHSQLVGLDFVPAVVEHKLALVRKDAGLHERVLAEAHREQRVWGEVGGLVAFVPAAARQPFESCIMPQAADPFFHTASNDSIAAIASLTRLYAQRLSSLTSSSDYNWWLHQASFHPHPPRGWHWHLEIMPRLTQLAGFELGTGCHITTMPPATAAALLRDGESTVIGNAPGSLAPLSPIH